MSEEQEDFGLTYGAWLALMFWAGLIIGALLW